jgi:hypothetical protein
LRRRAVLFAFERGGLLALAVLVAYVSIAPAHVVDGDNAEFATLGALGGTAHPSGYPVFVLWLRLTSWLPGATPAHTAAIATAILGAAAIAVLHAACRAWGARPVAASLACAIFAGAPVVMTMFSEAEVFALNSLVCATVLLVAAEQGPVRGCIRAAVLGLVAGLGLGNNLTCVLVAPIGLLGVVRGAREARSAALAVAIAIAALALGLVPYLYLLVAPAHAGTWGNVASLGDVVAMFLRSDYGGPTVLATNRPDVSSATSLLALAEMLGRTWIWLPAAAGLVMIGARVAGGESRWSWVALLASFLLAGPLLVIRFNIAPERTGLWVVHRFHILPALLLAIPSSLAIDRAPKLASNARGGMLALAVFAATAVSSLPHVWRVHSAAVEQQVRGMLRALPQHALVLGATDDVGSGTAYVQLVLGERTDVDYIHQPLLGLAWYRARLVARGFVLGELIDHALADGRAVYAQSYDRDVIAQFPHYRFGIFFRLLPRDQAPPSLDDVVAMNKELYERLSFDYAHPRVGDEWPAEVHDRFARTWFALADQLAASGRTEDASAARAYATEIGPWP